MSNIVAVRNDKVARCDEKKSEGLERYSVIVGDG